jgi:hypothetical protein
MSEDLSRWCYNRQQLYDKTVEEGPMATLEVNSIECGREVDNLPHNLSWLLSVHRKINNKMIYAETDLKVQQSSCFHLTSNLDQPVKLRFILPRFMIRYSLFN